MRGTHLLSMDFDTTLSLSHTVVNMSLLVNKPPFLAYPPHSSANICSCLRSVHVTPRRGILLSSNVLLLLCLFACSRFCGSGTGRHTREKQVVAWRHHRQPLVRHATSGYTFPSLRNPTCLFLGVIPPAAATALSLLYRSGILCVCVYAVVVVTRTQPGKKNLSNNSERNKKYSSLPLSPGITRMRSGGILFQGMRPHW